MCVCARACVWRDCLQDISGGRDAVHLWAVVQCVAKCCHDLRIFLREAVLSKCGCVVDVREERWSMGVVDVERGVVWDLVR